VDQVSGRSSTSCHQRPESTFSLLPQGLHFQVAVRFDPILVAFHSQRLDQPLATLLVGKNPDPQPASPQLQVDPLPDIPQHNFRVGVEQLDQEKLTPLLHLKYHGISEAVADLGSADKIRRAFAGFQR